jgi:hypothetical protein
MSTSENGALSGAGTGIDVDQLGDEWGRIVGLAKLTPDAFAMVPGKTLIMADSVLDHLMDCVAGLSGELDEARERARHVATEFNAVLRAEHRLSAAYLSVREVLGAMNPPSLEIEALHQYVTDTAKRLVAQRDALLSGAPAPAAAELDRRFDPRLLAAQAHLLDGMRRLGAGDLAEKLAEWMALYRAIDSGARSAGVMARTDGKAAASVRLTAAQLRHALEFIAPDFDIDADQRESEVVIAWRDAGAVVDDDGKPEPAGYVAWLADYPEEGCIPLSDKWPTGARPAPAGLIRLTDAQLAAALCEIAPGDEAAAGFSFEEWARERVNADAALDDARLIQEAVLAEIERLDRAASPAGAAR